MTFFFTPDEAQSTALSVIEHFKQLGVILKIEEKVWEDAPLRTTLSCDINGLTKLIEVQSKINYENIRGLALWLGAKRHYSELFLAVPSNASLQAQTISELNKDGVGLLVVNENGSVLQSFAPQNPALVVTPDPSLKFGHCKTEVLEAVEKCNNSNRKDALRDICEIVERETEILIVKAVRKAHLTLTEAVVIRQDWETQINTLASINTYTSGKTPIFDSKFKADMISFKGARNLFDHKAKGKRAEIERLKQCSERMMQGPRIIAKLVSLQRKVK